MEKSDRPAFTSIDLILEVICLAGLIKVILMLVEEYPILPDTIPIHYTISGEANSFADRWTILILPLISFVLYSVITILSLRPEKLKYSVPITADNQERQFANMAKLLRFIKLFVVGLTVFLTSKTVTNALQTNPKLSPVFLPITIVILIAIIAFFVYRSHKIR